MISKRQNLSVLWRVIKLAKPYKALFLTASVLAVVLAPMATLKPKLIQEMTDNYIVNKDLSGMKMILLILLGILIVEATLNYFFNFITSLLGANVVKDLRLKVFNTISSFKLKYFDTTPIGNSTTRTINDIETINSIFSEGIITIIADILTLVAVLGMMFYTSWKLTLFCMITLPFLIVAAYIFKEKVKKSFQKVRTEISKMNSFLQEHISGMKITQIFNAEAEDRAKFKIINYDYTKANLDSILYYAVFFPVVEIISAASLGIMVWYGAKGMLHDTITIGVMVSFPIYISMLFRPIRMLADKFNTLQMGIVAADRVFQLLDQHEYIESSGTLKPEKLIGKIKFDHVGFSYDDNEIVLKDVSFEVKPGESLAIVGSTGSGKSTIISLLNKFYENQKGHILIDNKEITEYDIKFLRKRIAVVLQDVFLFSGTVLDNITMRDPSISREKAIEAAKWIGADEYIQKLPGNYDFSVMERGTTLSMGQRQLLSFARALVFDPDILILDEATSSIDSESEQVVQKAIEKLIQKRTSIIIAHRLSTIKKADNIMVLEKGRVLEIGSHDTLIQNLEGHYKYLYDLQYEISEKEV